LELITLFVAVIVNEVSIFSNVMRDRLYMLTFYMEV